MRPLVRSQESNPGQTVSAGLPLPELENDLTRSPVTVTVLRDTIPLSAIDDGQNGAEELRGKASEEHLKPFRLVAVFLMNFTLS